MAKPLKTYRIRFTLKGITADFQCRAYCIKQAVASLVNNLGRPKAMTVHQLVAR